MKVDGIRAPLIGCLLAALLVTATAGAANVYRCVDAEGAVYFADRRCPAEQAEESIELAPMPRISGGEAPPPTDPLLLDRARRVDNALEDRKQEREKAAAARAARCEKLREHLTKLDSDNCDGDGTCTIYALVGKDASGEKVVLSENAKRAEVARVKSMISKLCR